MARQATPHCRQRGSSAVPMKPAARRRDKPDARRPVPPEALERRLLFSTHTVTALGDGFGSVAANGAGDFTASDLRVDVGAFKSQTPAPPSRPSISINDESVVEGNSGLRPITFRVSLDAAGSRTVKVRFATADGTARAGADYVAAHGTLTFSPGQTRKQVTVLVKGDTSKEADEAFFVNLFGPVNAAVADPTGRGLIRNDDGLVRVVYKAIPLSAPGFDGTFGYGIDAGQEVGSATLPDHFSDAILWTGPDATPIDLHPAGFAGSTAAAIKAGQQVGAGYLVDGMPHALLWKGSAASAVDLHPAGFDRSMATSTSGSQQAGVGYIENGPADFTGHALIWSGTAASVVDLHPAGFSYSTAAATTGSEQVGYGRAASDPPNSGHGHALLWHGTAASVVDLHPRHLINPFGNGDQPFNTSAALGAGGGEQVGYVYDANQPEPPSHAVVWKGTADSAVDLHPPQFVSTGASATNGTQQVGSGSLFVVADHIPQMVDHALLWSGTAGSVIDLHQFLPSQYTHSVAVGIDGAGNVVGYASIRDAGGAISHYQAFVWKPVPAGE